MNPQPKPQKSNEPTTKTTKKMKPMKQERRKVKPIAVVADVLLNSIIRERETNMEIMGICLF